MSSRHIVQCLFPGSAGLQPGLEATLERGVPRGMHKNSCGDALGAAFAPLIPGEDLLPGPDLHICAVGDVLEDATDMLRPMWRPHDVGVHGEA